MQWAAHELLLGFILSAQLDLPYGLLSPIRSSLYTMVDDQMEGDSPSTFCLRLMTEDAPGGVVFMNGRSKFDIDHITFVISTTHPRKNDSGEVNERQFKLRFAKRSWLPRAVDPVAFPCYPQKN